MPGPAGRWQVNPGSGAAETAGLSRARHQDRSAASRRRVWPVR